MALFIPFVHDQADFARLVSVETTIMLSSVRWNRFRPWKTLLSHVLITFPARYGMTVTPGLVWTRGVNSRRRVLTVGHASKRCPPSSVTRRTPSSVIGLTVVAWAEDWLWCLSWWTWMKRYKWPSMVCRNIWLLTLYLDDVTIFLLSPHHFCSQCCIGLTDSLLSSLTSTRFASEVWFNWCVWVVNTNDDEAWILCWNCYQNQV
jgi:hypothetical protein